GKCSRRSYGHDLGSVVGFRAWVLTKADRLEAFVGVRQPKGRRYEILRRYNWALVVVARRTGRAADVPERTDHRRLTSSRAPANPEAVPFPASQTQLRLRPFPQSGILECR